MSKEIRQMIDKIKNLKQFVNENKSDVDNVRKLYEKYGSKYPYATDAIAYYIFGDKSDDNKLIKSYKGAYGRNTQVDSTKVSKYMMDNEFSWEENIEDIDEFIKNLPTKDGGVLSDYY
jgi:ribosomal protein S15P/S13E